MIRRPSPLFRRAGFSLIEAAIVLAVVGIVIGGIWAAASSFHSSRRAANTVQNILVLSEAMRNFLPLSSYPTWTGGQIGGLTRTLYQAGRAPKDFIYNDANETLITPEGVSIAMMGACYGTNPNRTCPVLTVFVNINTGGISSLTTAECTRIVRQMAGILRDDRDVVRVQISPPNTLLDPPYTATPCTAATTNLQFYFRPRLHN